MLQEKSIVSHTFFDFGENRSIFNCRRDLFDFLSINDFLEGVSKRFPTSCLWQFVDNDAS